MEIEKIRKDFPILSRSVNGKPLVYLDNAASTQKPQRVLDRVYDFDSSEYSNIRRGSHKLGTDATLRYEEVRKKVAGFLGAGNDKEIIFTSGTTHGINLVARSFGGKFVKEDDEIIISHMEHHANLVPWQVLCEEKGAKLRVIPVNDRGELMMEEYERLLNPRTRMVAVTHVSNSLGTINPVKEIIARARSVGATTLIDGAQSAPHMPIDVQDLDCDFFALSGHKVFGPSGVGVLYGKLDLLESMPPFLLGGDMILNVTLEKTTYARPPGRFEAGTPPISQVIGLGEAIGYVQEIGMERIHDYELGLLRYGTELLQEIPGLRIIGTAQDKAGIISFHMEDVHPHDAVTLLDLEGIAVRGGHHCSQPIMDRFGVPATVRASLALYNKREELDCLVAGIRKIRKVFS